MGTAACWQLGFCRTNSPLSCLTGASELQFLRFLGGTMAAAPVLPASPDPTPEPAGLSQVERVIDTYIAPKKTFTDIRRSAQWWFPFLLALLVGSALVYVAEQKIGVRKMVENE